MTNDQNGDAVLLSSSSNNTIYDNNITINSIAYGTYLQSNSNYNIIYNNNVSYGQGIQLSASSYNQLYSNIS